MIVVGVNYRVKIRAATVVAARILSMAEGILSSYPNANNGGKIQVITLRASRNGSTVSFDKASILVPLHITDSDYDDRCSLYVTNSAIVYPGNTFRGGFLRENGTYAEPFSISFSSSGTSATGEIDLAGSYEITAIIFLE